jgi:hypothetical protein
VPTQILNIQKEESETSGNVLDISLQSTMVRKKKRREDDVVVICFCYYCDRRFGDEVRFLVSCRDRTQILN